MSLELIKQELKKIEEKRGKNYCNAIDLCSQIIVTASILSLMAKKPDCANPNDLNGTAETLVNSINWYRRIIQKQYNIPQELIGIDLTNICLAASKDFRD